MTTCPYTPEQLAEMRANYVLLVSGKMARVVVDQNGERVEFTSANAARLYALIQEAAACLEPGPVTARPNRPMEFYF